jgi:hypothetical protein
LLNDEENLVLLTVNPRTLRLLQHAMDTACFLI